MQNAIATRGLAGLCLCLAACASFPRMDVDTTDAQAQDYARTGNLQAQVDALARPLIDRHQTPGLVVGVLLADGSQHIFSYGWADQAAHLAPEGDTLFATGSVSKEFLGALAAILVREGTLAWSDTLGMLLPASAPLSADARNITLRQLATHTAGLPNQPTTFKTFRYFTGYLFTGRSFYRHLNQDYVFRYLTDFKAPRPVKFHYSNLGYALLGVALEQRTGQSLDVLMARKLFDPLGLTHTGYHPEALPGYAARARGYAGDEPKFIGRGKPTPDWTFTEFMKGTGGLYSNAHDLLTFAAAHVHPARSPLDRALHDTLAVPIGWFVDDRDSRRIFYQVGIVGGYSSYLGLDPRQGTAVVVLENSFHWQSPVGHRLLVRLRGGGT